MNISLQYAKDTKCIGHKDYPIDMQPVKFPAICLPPCCDLSLDTHSKFKSFGVVRMPHLLILGLDWLMAHNPSVDGFSSAFCFLAVAWE